MKSLLKRHFFGLLLFLVILQAFVLALNAHRIPYLRDKLPYRHVVRAKQPIKLYQCEGFRQRRQLRVLETGEVADLEGVFCGHDTRWSIKLPDGTQACYSAEDEDKVEH